MTGAPLPLRFGDDGLVSAVITDATSGDVLMVGFMNEAAFAATRETGFVHFWSRSRQKLWKKGETSGHVQQVEQISVNCELNSLLIEVNQTGAVCHDGYPTCFYRRLESDNSLTIVRDRWFDPADVYGDQDGLGSLTRLWWNAYQWLRDHDLTAVSGTSRLLRSESDGVTSRIADELNELAGALDGTHRHESLVSDVALEGGQVCYWVMLRCLRAGLTWDDVRPDRALDAPGDPAAPSVLVSLLKGEAVAWSLVSSDAVAAQAHSTLTLVAASCFKAGVEPSDLIRRDLDDLRSRPYLTGYFASQPGSPTP